MKKILVLLMLLVCINAFSLDILSADFGLEMGWLPRGTLNMYEIDGVKIHDVTNTFYVILGSRVYLLQYLFFGGSIDLTTYWMGYGFDTEGLSYMFETGIKIGIFELFYKHNCMHPAPTYLYRYIFDGIWEGWHDRIGIKISGEIGK